jgi:hypothetical protein
MNIKDHLTTEQVGVFLKLCEETDIDINDMKYGSLTLTAKYWFMMGWDAANQASQAKQ